VRKHVHHATETHKYHCLTTHCVRLEHSVLVDEVGAGSGESKQEWRSAEKAALLILVA
jgi:hypothetical protein